MNRHMTRAAIVLAAMTIAHPFEGLASFNLLATAQDAAAKAAAVLAEARKAVGGEEKLRAVKTLQASGDVRRSMGEMQLEGELEVLIESPGRMRRNESIGMPGGATMVRTEVLNGDDTWEDSSQRGGMGGQMMIMRGPGGADMSEEQIKEMRRRMRRADLARLMLAWLLTTDAPVAHGGIAEAPDGSADVLDVQGPDGRPMRLFIDRQTRLPLMLTWQGPAMRTMIRRGPGGPRPDPEQVAREAAAQGPPPMATFEMRLDDYRDVSGLRLPHQITRGSDGAVNEEWTIKSYKVNASFKDNTFTK